MGPATFVTNCSDKIVSLYITDVFTKEIYIIHWRSALSWIFYRVSWLPKISWLIILLMAFDKIKFFAQSPTHSTRTSKTHFMQPSVLWQWWVNKVWGKRIGRLEQFLWCWSRLLRLHQAFTGDTAILWTCTHCFYLLQYFLLWPLKYIHRWRHSLSPCRAQNKVSANICNKIMRNIEFLPWKPVNLKTCIIGGFKSTPQ